MSLGEVRRMQAGLAGESMMKWRGPPDSRLLNSRPSDSDSKPPDSRSGIPEPKSVARAL